MEAPEKSSSLKEKLRLRMATMDSPKHLALLSVVVGILAGLVIVAFRLVIEMTQASFLPGNDPENYEALVWWQRLLLPIGGALLIGVVFQLVKQKDRVVGVVHAMERIAYHQARLPLANGLLQFFGAAVSIIAGHSVGREGPSIHLGATSGSQVGQLLQLPNHSTRILVACGVAGAIAASFNTPLAGVIFAMEVVLMEYTMIGFIPVIFASVAATAVSRTVFGSSTIFAVPALHLETLHELPFVIFTGVAIGCIAVLFINALQFFSRQGTQIPIWIRMTLAGVIVGICSVAVPEIMSIGYDTVSAAMFGNLSIMLLIVIMFMKVFATSAGLGLGLPGGLIGPTLIIGATGGAAMGLIANQISPDITSNPAVYAMIGMGAMMGATLQAPLAALTAILELTANPNIIMPAMLAIVCASLVANQLFGKDSIFIHAMRARGMDYHDNPITKSLRNIGVMKVMDEKLVVTPPIISQQRLAEIVAQQPNWVLVYEEGRKGTLISTANLEAPWEKISAEAEHEDADANEINLLELPTPQRRATAINLRETLYDAQLALRNSDDDALFVINPRAGGTQHSIFGVITFETIEQYYRY